MTYVNDLTPKYAEVKKIVIKILSIKKEKLFSSLSLNFPVPLSVYVFFCLRKQWLMAFCEKSRLGADIFSIHPPMCKKRVMCCGGGEFSREVKLRVKN